MTDDKTKDKVYVQIADLFQKASAAQLSRMQMYGGDIRSTFRTVTHLSFFLSALDVYVIHRRRRNEPTPQTRRDQIAASVDTSTRPTSDR